MTIVCIDRPYSHHGGHSGYKILAKFLNAEVITNPSKPSRLLDLLPEKPLNSFLQLHPNWYTKDALRIEWNISKQLLFHSNIIFHFLYGENSFRRTGKVNALTGRKNAVVATYHQLPKFFEHRREQLSFLKDLDAAVLVSSNQKAFFESIMSREKVHFVPHGVDVNFFHPSPVAKLPPMVLRCLTVGSNYRDIDLYLRVIEKLNKSSLAGNIEFEIIGEERFSTTFTGIKNLVYRSGVSDQELLQAYQSADVFLMPLQATTANNAVLEAMACGLPLVVSDVEGIRDYVNEAFSVLVPPHDVDAMVDGILMLLADYETRVLMGNLARNEAENAYDWRFVARKMQDVYCSVAGSPLVRDL